jgi:hypothetical protein
MNSSPGGPDALGRRNSTWPTTTVVLGLPPALTDCNESRTRIKSAYAGRILESDNGLTSPIADSTHFALGVAEASSAVHHLPGDVFRAGTSMTAACSFAFTRYGDANLDGVVNLPDFNRLAGQLRLCRQSLERRRFQLRRAP